MSRPAELSCSLFGFALLISGCSKPPPPPKTPPQAFLDSDVVISDAQGRIVTAPDMGGESWALVSGSTGAPEWRAVPVVENPVEPGDRAWLISPSVAVLNDHSVAIQDAEGRVLVILNYGDCYALVLRADGTPAWKTIRTNEDTKATAKDTGWLVNPTLRVLPRKPIELPSEDQK